MKKFLLRVCVCDLSQRIFPEILKTMKNAEIKQIDFSGKIEFEGKTRQNVESEQT